MAAATQCPSPLRPPDAAARNMRPAASISFRPQPTPPVRPRRSGLLSSSRFVCPVESPFGRHGAAAAAAATKLRGGSNGFPVAIRCFFSQVHSYGTVDYEQQRAARLKWSSLYRRIAMTEDPEVGAAAELEKWEAEERRLSKWELCRVVKELRKFRRFKLAIDVYEWMSSQGDRFNIYSSDIAIQLDLMSKVRGISYAETYFARLSETLKDKRTYGALLNGYMHAKMKEKAEVVFEKMKERGYATDPLPFNVMMTLYMNVGEHEKVKSIITEMEERRIPLDIFSYNIWITACAARGDAEEMEQVFEQMDSDRSINPNWTTYSTLATMYIRLGNMEKAEKCLKDAELRMTGRDRLSYNYLLGLYGLLGKKEEIYRIWDWYKASFPSILNTGYHSMLTSLVKVGDIGGAEAIYKEWIYTTSNYDPKIWNIMMAWYVREGLVTKAQACLDDMLNLGGKPNPSSWEILADGYVQAKQTSMALNCIKEAASVERPTPKTWRPRPVTIANFLVLCAEQNETASVEVLVNVLKKVKCLNSEEYKSLINMYAGAALQEKLRAQEER